MSWQPVVIALAIYSAIMIAGCSKDAEAPKQKTSNEKITVDRLFTHEGTTVYRFQDAGRVIYYAVPYKGPIELTEFHEECVTTSDGKNVHTDCTTVNQSSVTVN